MSRFPAKSLGGAGMLAWLAWLGCPAEARAQGSTTPEISVEPVGCDELDIEETERLLRVELAVVAARAERPRAPRVTVACTNATLHIEITDPLTEAKRALDLPAPVRAAGRERTVALAASQLFLSSWLEMIVKEPPKAAPAPPPPSPASPIAPAPRTQGQSAHYELAAGAGARLRDLSHLATELSGELRATRVTSSRWLFGLRAGGELGAVTRSSGAIHTLALDAGIHGGFRLASTIWAIDTEAALGLYLLHASATPSSAATLGASATGGALQFALLGCPALRVPPMRVSVCAEAGLTAPQLVLRVAHDEPTRASGFWLGSMLLVGAELGS
jgi:hypothetical protein